MEIKKVSSASLENKTHDFLLMGLVVALGFLFIIFEWSSVDVKKIEPVRDMDFFVEEELIPTTTQNLTPPPPAVAAPPRVIAPTIVVVEKTDVPEVDFVPTDPTVDVDVVAYNPTVEEPEEEPVFGVCEKSPSFPGGQTAMMEFLSKNVKYPAVCQEAGIQGRVFVSFVVDKDGNIVDVTVLKGVHEKLDAEAVRVVSSMPTWIPGEMQGRKVKARFQLPVSFRMAN